MKELIKKTPKHIAEHKILLTKVQVIQNKIDLITLVNPEIPANTDLITLLSSKNSKMGNKVIRSCVLSCIRLFT